MFNENEIATAAAVKVVEDATMGTWNKVKGYFRDISEKERIDTGRAYEEYLSRTREKYSKVKTLIYRRDPKDLYSIYECIGVEFGGKSIDTSTINNLLDVSGKLIITGTGGIGKTMLLKHLFLNTIEDTRFIPVLIELRGLNSREIKDIAIEQTVYDSLVNNGFKIEQKYFTYSMEQGAYVILFDGFDEINRERLQLITKQLIEIGDKYPKNKYILSSRPSEDFIGWQNYTEMKSMDLTKEQALNLIERLDFDEEVKSAFKEDLKTTSFDKYKSFASNPLLLTILLLTFDSRATIPDRLSDFYEVAFSTLFNMHDATKGAYVRDIRSKLSCEDFKLIFAYVCFKSYFSNDYEFTEELLEDYIQQAKNKFPEIKFRDRDFKEDLVQSVCMLIKEGRTYRFSHRSFQEYFAAWYTCKLTDDIQYKLVNGYIKEKTFLVRSEEYFVILYNLQSHKFNKIILQPALKKIKSRYKTHGFSLYFLEAIYDKIYIEKRTSSDEFDVSLHIKDSYLNSVLNMAAQFNGYRIKINKAEDLEEEECIRVLYEKLKESNYLDTADINGVRGINLSEAADIIGEKKLLNLFNGIKSKLDFCMEVLDEIQKDVIGNKRKVASIIESL